MVDKKEDKTKKDSFSDSSEIFERIFKEATQEIQKETGKIVSKPGLKLKPKPKAKPRPELKPKAPTKLELESEPEPKIELKQRPRVEARPKIQPPMFKPGQEPTRRPVPRKPGPDKEEKEAELLSTGPLVRGRIQEKKPKEESAQETTKPKPAKKRAGGLPVLKVLLLLVLLAAGVGGASVYLGIIDVSNYLGQPEPAKKEAPKDAATVTPPAQTAAKLPQQPAVKAAQPSKPQTKPVEGPKPAAQSQTVQPPQAPPKPAEAVTPVPPSPPPEVQAKPAPPVPPAVAKAETPAPPVKVEPPPAPVQPPVKSEPIAPPATVQPPEVPKKAETPKPGSQPKEVAVAKTLPPVSGSGVSYPFSVYLGSFQNLEYLKRALSIYENQGLSSYWTKVELGAKGTWYRVFAGYFTSAQEAEAFIQQKRIKDGEVKETRYSTLIGTFGTKQGGEEKALALSRMGVSAYLIQGADGQVRLYSGAFNTKESAEKHQAELNSSAIKSEIVAR